MHPGYLSYDLLSADLIFFHDLISVRTIDYGNDSQIVALLLSQQIELTVIVQCQLLC